MNSASASTALWRGPSAGQVAVGAAVAAVSVALSVRLVSVSSTTVPLAVGLALVAAWMAVSRRYELTLAVLLLYLGLLDGYIKLKLNTPWATLGRDVLLYAIVIGALVRLAATDRRIELPPLAGWVLGFTAAVLVQLFNPANGLTFGALASVRPHLEWVPLFFFGFVVVRSKRRLRGFLLLVLIVAAANGVASYIQFDLTPEELARWGPGYEERIMGTGDVGGRVFLDDTGTLRTRPFALGADSGFGGVIGAIAVPAAIALLLVRRRVVTGFVVAVLSVGAVVAVATSQARVAIVAAVIAAIGFFVLASAARRILPTLVGLVLALAVTGLALSLLAGDGERSIFRDYQSVSPARVVETTANYRRDNLALIPQYVRDFPFGAGLGGGGPAAGYLLSTGATPVAQIDAETELTYLLAELGIAGALLMTGFNLALFALALVRTRRLPDPESRLLVAAVVAPLFALFATWVVGVATASTPSAPYFWFAAGVVAYWLGVVAVRRAPAERAAVSAPREGALSPPRPRPLGAVSQPPPSLQPASDLRRRRGYAKLAAASAEQALRIAVVYRSGRPSIDGIRDASERLTEALSAAGHNARLELVRGAGDEDCLRDVDLVVVQYNPFSWGRWGVAPRLVRMMRRLRGRPGRPVLALMVHEPFMPLTGVRGTLMGVWQRLQLAALRRISDITFVSIEAWMGAVRKWGPRRQLVEHLPVGSNLPDMRAERAAARARLGAGDDTLVVAIFGTGHPSRRVDLVARSISALAESGFELIMLNLGAGAPKLPRLSPGIGVEAPGALPAPEVARLLSAADVLLAPFVDGVSTRRGTMMAGLQHEVAVIGTRGPLTDATLRDAETSLALVPVEAGHEFPKRVLSICRLPHARRQLAAEGRRLYERQFDWPVVARRLISAARAVHQARISS
jgi:glycosyltransferase involved in cell wall biosynthesis